MASAMTAKETTVVTVPSASTKVRAAYASGTVDWTLGNQGWPDNATPSGGLAPYNVAPAAPFNNYANLSTPASSWQMAMLYEVGADAVSAVTGSQAGGVITVGFTYRSRTYTITFDTATGEVGGL